MNSPSINASLSRWLQTVGLCLLLAGPSGLAANPSPLADLLQARYISLQGQLTHNTFNRPLHLASTESAEELKGDIYAVLDQPFESVQQGTRNIDNWCDILILHLNVKHCRAISSPSAQALKVYIGKKHDEPLGKSFPVNFSFRVAATTPDYLRIRLQADTGPLGTNNYRITFEAVPLPEGRTFLHLAYSYDYGLTARLAMKGYLATIGSGKVGFSTIETRPDGTPVLISGVRGVVERNTMRYYLAIEAYLKSLTAPPTEQLERRLHHWFAATEQYRQQLHELEEADYLAMKHKEVLRQQTLVEADEPN